MASLCPRDTGGLWDKLSALLVCLMHLFDCDVVANKDWLLWLCGVRRSETFPKGQLQSRMLRKELLTVLWFNHEQINFLIMSDQRRLIICCYCRVNLCSFAGVGGLLDPVGRLQCTAVHKTTNIHSSEVLSEIKGVWAEMMDEPMKCWYCSLAVLAYIKICRCVSDALCHISVMSLTINVACSSLIFKHHPI